MNESFKIQRPDQIVNIRQKDIKKQTVHLGRVKVRPGQSLWELNISTLEVVPVKYDVTAVGIDGSINSQVITKEDHLYCVAINKKNAVRKFILMCNKITHDA